MHPQHTQIQGQPGPKRETGLIAILLSGAITFKTAYPVADLTESLMRANGFDSGFGLGIFAAIVIEWKLLAHLFQFIIDEFIMARFYRNRAAKDAQWLLAKLDGKKRGGFPWLWVLGALTLTYFFGYPL